MTPQERELAKLRTLSRLMDSAFTIPGTNIRYGLDAIIGLVPVVGDTLSLVISSYIISSARKMGVPWHIRTRMMWNLFVDWSVGIIPFFGDAFDVAWKANIKNMALLEKHLKKEVLDGDFTRIS